MHIIPPAGLFPEFYSVRLSAYCSGKPAKVNSSYHMSHTFHIPVLGLGYSVDTPLKVARYGISSVASIVDDQLLERMRQFYTEKSGEIFVPIHAREHDSRSRRITAYLNMMNHMVNEQFLQLRQSPFEPGTEITRYFDLLPEESALKKRYNSMLQVQDKEIKALMQNELRQNIQKGRIDVNIMSKVDKLNFNSKGESLGDQFSDALSALRGFAQSELHSAVILSAGMNPRLYSYLENFEDFFPVAFGEFKKQVILKVSDFRSAFIQAKFLAKKGIWVSEFRVESGLNCGGHAFATDGYLIGPILEEFKARRKEMTAELFDIYQSGLAQKGFTISTAPSLRISAQGGIGTAYENAFMLNYYELDATGWGSPFLLVPEATNVDENTLQHLLKATADDFYISGSSPLGVPFNNYRHSSAEKLRLERIAKGKPGSPCTKKYLVSNTEFTEEPICTASRKYQNLKIAQLATLGLSDEEYQRQVDSITEKVCLCEGLTTATYLKNNMLKPKESKAVVICPGPNLAYFNRLMSLDDMVKYIYGKFQLPGMPVRPHMFINELNLYVDYFQKDFSENLKNFSDKKAKQLAKFREQLQAGIKYYKGIIPDLIQGSENCVEKIKLQLELIENKLQQVAYTELAETR
jgi:hypothetical protein